MRSFKLAVAGKPSQYVSSHRSLDVMLGSPLSCRSHKITLEAKGQPCIALTRHIADIRCSNVSRALLTFAGRCAWIHPAQLALAAGNTAIVSAQLQRLFTRSLRVCLGVPWRADSFLIIAATGELPLRVLRFDQALRHYVRLLAHHKRHPLLSRISRRPHR